MAMRAAVPPPLLAAFGATATAAGARSFQTARARSLCWWGKISLLVEQLPALQKLFLPETHAPDSLAHPRRDGGRAAAERPGAQEHDHSRARH